uniref:Uncharacterized protein n=1 Tax=Timema tahoe TaxID=61484 RepID=A0A7R9IP58_9NEOP|nr:unnamed protein product [Timema tahoe]
MSGDYSAMPEEGIILNALAMVLVALGILLSYAVRRDSFRTELGKFGKTHLKPYFNSTVQVKKQGIPILFRFALSLTGWTGTGDSCFPPIHGGNRSHLLPLTEATLRSPVFPVCRGMGLLRSLCVGSNLPLLVRMSGGAHVPAHAPLTVRANTGALKRLTTRMERPGPKSPDPTMLPTPSLIDLTHVRLSPASRVSVLVLVLVTVTSLSPIPSLALCLFSLCASLRLSRGSLTYSVLALSEAYVASLSPKVGISQDTPHQPPLHFLLVRSYLKRTGTFQHNVFRGTHFTAFT